MTKQLTLRGTVRRVFFCNAESPFMAGVLGLDEESAGTARKAEARFSGKIAAQVGDNVHLQWDAAQAHLFDAASGTRLPE